MKKVLSIVLVLVMVLAYAGCGQQKEFDIAIRIPAHTEKEFKYNEDFIFSDEEISPNGDTITITAGEGLGDTEVYLMPIEVKEENAYEATYLTPGMPVKIDVEKGAWFKIGVAVNNETDEDMTVYVHVEKVDVRIQ